MAHTMLALQERRDVLLNVMEVFVQEPHLDWLEHAKQKASQVQQPSPHPSQSSAAASGMQQPQSSGSRPQSAFASFAAAPSVPGSLLGKRRRRGESVESVVSVVDAEATLISSADDTPALPSIDVDEPGPASSRSTASRRSKASSRSQVSRISPSGSGSAIEQPDLAASCGPAAAAGVNPDALRTLDLLTEYPKQKIRIATVRLGFSGV